MSEREADGLYKLQNPKPSFLPYDFCQIVGTNEFVLITEINCNRCQTNDDWQWSYAAEPLTKGQSKFAWWSAHELERICNIFEIIAKRSMHPFSGSAYKFDLNTLKRESE